MVRKDILVTVGASLASAGVASVVTWVVANRKLAGAYEARLEEEIKFSVQHIIEQAGLNNVIVSDQDPDELVEELNEVEQPVDVVVSELEEVEGERVFTSEDSKPPIDELVARNQTTQYNKIMTPDVAEEPEEELFPEQPDIVEEDPDISVISRDIFFENGTEWPQETVTFFSDGGVLDQQGDFIEDHEKLIGPGKPRFGEESEDQNVVYVRNKRDEKEFEILWDPGLASDFLAHSLAQTHGPSWAR